VVLTQECTYRAGNCVMPMASAADSSLLSSFQIMFPLTLRVHGHADVKVLVSNWPIGSRSLEEGPPMGRRFPGERERKKR
jgi:hypothetical protein